MLDQAHAQDEQDIDWNDIFVDDGGGDDEWAFFDDDFYSTKCMVLIEGGEYHLGFSEAEIKGWFEEFIPDKKKCEQKIADYMKKCAKIKEGRLNPRVVTIEPFYILDHEVSCAAYREFIVRTGREAPKTTMWTDFSREYRQLHAWRGADYPPGRSMYPIMTGAGLESEDALAFCRWLSEKTGVLCRLPTADEWEAAYRGRDGWRFPWGNEFPQLPDFPIDRIYTTGPDSYWGETIDSTPQGIMHMFTNLTEYVIVNPKAMFDMSADPKKEDIGVLGLSYSASPADGIPFLPVIGSYTSWRIGFRYVIPIRNGKPIPWKANENESAADSP